MLSSVRTAAALVVLLLGSLGLSGCSGNSADEALGPKPSLPATPTEALWNPCTALSLDRVETLLDSSLSRNAGTPEEPICQFTPTVEGGPAVTVNYQLFNGTMEQLIASFGVISNAPGSNDRTEVEKVNEPRSDGARLVLLVQDDTLAITGFVKNGALVQLVNLVQPAPYDREVLRAGVAKMIGNLAARADESGLSD